MDELEECLRELTCGDDRRAETALQELAKHDASALPPLLELQQSRTPDHRWWATVALSHIPGHRSQRALCRALEDAHDEVKQAAALGLKDQPTPEAIPTLLRLLGHSDRVLARLAANALVAVGGDAVSPLTVALREEDAQVRTEAARALARIKDTAVIPALFAALKDPSSMVTYWAEEGLRRQGVGMVFFGT